MERLNAVLVCYVADFFLTPLLQNCLVQGKDQQLLMKSGKLNMFSMKLIIEDGIKKSLCDLCEVKVQRNISLLLCLCP